MWPHVSALYTQTNSLGPLCLFLLCGDNSLVGGLFCVCMVFVFLVKIPMFMVNLWLPKSQVEAPVSGSTWYNFVWCSVEIRALWSSSCFSCIVQSIFL